MKNIPTIKSTVIYNKNEYKVLSCKVGGKCTIKKLRLPNKGKVIKNVDILELIETN